MKKINKTYNPDVLNCIANLSNDEVFTPPALANKMLDTLPQSLFSNPDVKFLDPFCKSGVFLREIVKRLDRGLACQMPDVEKRINHILKKQVYGIAITELTSLLSRRTVYCSKVANGSQSVVRFSDADGNIYYKPMQHTWAGGKCKYCGASQSVYERTDDAETYAYNFIHVENINQIFNMRFDVIIGNPPYHLTDGSGASDDAAMPIYHKFIEKAISLNPRYIVMIIPSKWMVGGRGLAKFRQSFSTDKHIKYLYDYEDASQCFPGVHIDGGVCYFLRDSMYEGDVQHIYHSNNGTIAESVHSLENKYFDFVLRDTRVVSILEKIGGVEKFSSIVSSTKPYGIRKDLFNHPERYPNSEISDVRFENSVKIFGVKGIKGGARRQNAYINRLIASDSNQTMYKYKIFFTTTYSTDAISFPEPILAKPGQICTETFLVVGPFQSEDIQKNCYSYMQTSFFKFLLYYGHGTMQVSKSVFGLIPLQDFSHPWTDEMLYEKYKLDDTEIDFIESMIKPME